MTKLAKAVIVLGAGASKGAQVVGKRTPPLDADFLSVAAEYFRRKKPRGEGRQRVLDWNLFKKRLMSAGLRFDDVKSWRLEELSTFLEARANLRGMQLARGRPFDHAKALDALKTIVCHVLLAEGGVRVCELHKMLFSLVRPKAIVSFNYDLIADQSLAALRALDWKSQEYRHARRAHVVRSDGSESYQLVPIRRRKRGDGLAPLLKLHGSIHYEKLHRGDGFRLGGVSLPTREQPLFEFNQVPEHPYIIPPVAAKIEIKQAAIRANWRLALRNLHDAPLWIIWGYSFPKTDTISQVLFRTALTLNRKPKPVIVVNPDASVVQRVKEVCVKVKVEHFPSMERMLLEYGSLVEVTD